MRKYSPVISLILALVFLAAAASCKGTASKGNIAYIEYGAEVCVRDYAEGGYVLKDGNNRRIYPEHDKFTACDREGYTLAWEEAGKRKKLRLEVKDGLAPVIHTSFDKKYVAKDSPLVLPGISALDYSDGDVEYGTCLKKDGKKAGGVFSECGRYELEITAKDGAGNKSLKTVTYEAVERSSRKLFTIADFSDPYGLNQYFEPVGFDVSYTEEVHPRYEKGSLKLKHNLDFCTAQSLRLKNVFIEDITEYEMIYFDALNAGDKPIKISLNYGKDYQLMPGLWTEIVLYSGDYQDIFAGSHNEVIRELYTPGNINGMMIGTFVDWLTMPAATVYISSVYAVPKVDAGTLDGYISDVKNLGEREFVEKFDWINKLYSCMSGKEAEKVSGFESLSTKSVRAEITDLGYEVPENEIVAFNTPVGPKQIIASSSYVYYTDEMRYADEGGSAAVVTGTDWRCDLVCNLPLLSNITGYSEVYTYIYHENEGMDFYAGFGDSMTESVYLKPGRWTRVYLKNLEHLKTGCSPNVSYRNIPDTRDVKGMTLYIFANMWNDMVPFNTKFYVSGIYAC